MTEKELIELRNGAEVTKIQFKERVLDKYDTACELVAFSNSRGGKIIVGINDKTGNINPLSFVEIQETTNLLTNLASENVFPNILISIDTVKVDGGQVVIATIPEGKNKPYHDNKGIVWVKNGSDKRRVFDNAELAEMMTECGSFHPDEAAVNDSSIDDLDIETVKLFLLGRFASRFENVGLSEVDLRKQPIEKLVDIIGEGFTLEKLFRNLRFIRPDGRLTVAAMLLFGKAPQRWLPVLTTKCVSFGTLFIDSLVKHFALLLFLQGFITQGLRYALCLLNLLLCNLHLILLVSPYGIQIAEFGFLLFKNVVITFQMLLASLGFGLSSLH